MFAGLGMAMKFSLARRCGAALLAQNEDGICFYLKNDVCRIHKNRPAVCRRFFCSSKRKEFQKMIEVIKSAGATTATASSTPTASGGSPAAADAGSAITGTGCR